MRTITVGMKVSAVKTEDGKIEVKCMPAAYICINDDDITARDDSFAQGQEMLARIRRAIKQEFNPATPTKE